MNIKLLALAGCTALALSVSAAYAVPSNEGPAAGKHVMHRHHVARYKAPNGPVSDVPQESAPPAETPAADPYQFGHAGSGTSYY